MDVSLKKLIEKCAKNDRKAQAQVYQLYAGKLFALCLKYSKNNQDAQDNLHDGFITIFNKIEQYNFKGSFDGWVKRIIINTSLLKYRDKSILNVVTDKVYEGVIVELDENNISLEYLLKIVQELPNKYRAVFNLYVLDEFSHKEISKELNISVGTSKSNLSRARLILKNKIEEYHHNQSTTKIHL